MAPTHLGPIGTRGLSGRSEGWYRVLGVQWRPQDPIRFYQTSTEVSPPFCPRVVAVLFNSVGRHLFHTCTIDVERTISDDPAYEVSDLLSTSRRLREELDFTTGRDGWYNCPACAESLALAALERLPALRNLEEDDYLVLVTVNRRPCKTCGG